MPVIGKSLAELLDDTFERLTDPEKAIIYYMAGEAEPMSLGQIFQ